MSVEEAPRFTKSEAFDLARAVAWALFTPVAYKLGWLSSVTFVSLLSLWALAEGAYSAYRGGASRQLRTIEAKLDRLLSESELR